MDAVSLRPWKRRRQGVQPPSVSPDWTGERFSGIGRPAHEGGVPYYTKLAQTAGLVVTGFLPQDALVNQDSLQPLYTTGTGFP